MATFIGNTLAGVFKILAGAIGLVVDILTGKWSKAWGDVKKILSGMADIALASIRGFLAAFGDLPGKVLNFFKQIVTDILSFLEIASPSKKFFRIGLNIVNGLLSGLSGLGDAVLNAISGGFDAVFAFFRNLPGKLKNLAGNAVDAVVKVFGGLGQKALDAP